MTSLTLRLKVGICSLSFGFTSAGCEALHTSDCQQSFKSGPQYPVVIEPRECERDLACNAFMWVLSFEMHPPPIIFFQIQIYKFIYDE